MFVEESDKIIGRLGVQLEEAAVYLRVTSLRPKKTSPLSKLTKSDET